MKKWLVTIKEVSLQMCSIEAETIEDVRSILANDDRMSEIHFGEIETESEIMSIDEVE